MLCYLSPRTSVCRSVDAFVQWSAMVTMLPLSLAPAWILASNPAVISHRSWSNDWLIWVPCMETVCGVYKPYPNTNSTCIWRSKKKSCEIFIKSILYYVCLLHVVHSFFGCSLLVCLFVNITIHFYYYNSSALLQSTFVQWNTCVLWDELLCSSSSNNNMRFQRLVHARIEE